VLLHERDQRSYVDALVSFQEYQATYALLLLGGNPLLGRIQRILSRENRPLNGAEKILLFLGLLIIPAFGFMTKRELNLKKPNAAAVATLSKMTNEASARRRLGITDQQEVPTGRAGLSAVISEGNPRKTTIINVRNGSSPTRNDTLPTKKDTIIEMAIPAGPMDFTDISRKDRIDADGSVTVLQATDENGKHYVITKRDHHLVALSIDGASIPDEQLGGYDELADFVPAVQGLKARNLPKDWVEEWLKIERLSVHFDHERKKIDENMTASFDNLEKLNDLKSQFEAAMQHITIEYRRKRRMANPLADVSQTIVDIINDLRKEKLFSTPGDTLLLLDQTGLYLDGEKQSDNVFALFKAKYLHRPGDHYKYLDSEGTIQTWQ
jgi:hypothetical protein